jgi:uncharacterized protein
MKTMPFIGYGLGLRTPYYEDILASKPEVDWFEIITENYLVPGGNPLRYLDKIRELYPMVMHGVSLSLGGTDPLDLVYLGQVKELAERVEPVWVSDHLCWTGVHGVNLHDLLPLPYTQETVNHVVSRIQQVQELLARPILIENVSSYLTFTHSEMTEWEFIVEIIKQSGAFILLDVNNVYVSSINHRFNALDFIHAMPKERVAQIHLAGHTSHENYLIDTHDAPVPKEVWELYKATIAHLGKVSTMIERDDNYPPFAELLSEMNYAKSLANRVVEEEAVA